MWQEENKYGHLMQNIGHMTFIFELNLAIVKASMPSKNEDAVLRHSRVILLTVTHKHLWNHYDTCCHGQ